MSRHVLGIPYEHRGRWKIGCLTCDYWTGYTSRNKAEKSAQQHVKAMEEKE